MVAQAARLADNAVAARAARSLDFIAPSQIAKRADQTKSHGRSISGGGSSTVDAHAKYDILQYKMTGEARIETGAENRRAQLLKGLAELGLLSLLAERACYGLEILDRLRAEAGLEVAEGTIYPLLHRLERAGLAAAEWKLETEGARPRKYYALTEAGRAELVAQSTEWKRLSQGLSAFLDRSGT